MIVPMSPADGTLVRQMAAHFVAALWVWLGAVVLITAAGMVRLPMVSALLTGLPDTRYALSTGLLRFGTLFWRCLVFLLALELLVFLLCHFGLEPSLAAHFSRNLAIGFAGLALLYGVLGAVSMFHDRDPWEYLPGGPPFALREFARQHPHLHVETVGALGGSRVFLSRGSSSRVYFDETDLQSAVLSWEKCTDPDEVMRLGGPPPFPGTQCWARIQILRDQHRSLDSAASADEEEDEQEEKDISEDVPAPKERVMRYVYYGGRPTAGEIQQHVLAWAKNVGIEPRVAGDITFTSGGLAWTISTTMRNLHQPWVEDIYVECAEPLPP